MRPVKGFTLIELLVTMSLLSMIILIASSAFGIFSQKWDGRLGTFDKTISSARNLVLVQSILDSLIPYVAFNSLGKPIFYFEGNRNGFVGVSSDSILSPGYYSVVRLSVKEKPNQNFDVIYEEWPMTDELLVSTGVALPFSKPLVIFSSVESPLFQYFGWEDLRAREADFDTKLPPRWLPSFNGVSASMSPLKASLTFNTPAGEYRFISSIAPENAGLLSRYKARSAFDRGKAPSPSVDDEKFDCFC